MTNNIKTEFVYPPIPIRSFDWVAYLEGTEESQEYGYGSTEKEAVGNLLIILQDKEEGVN